MRSSLRFSTLRTSLSTFALGAAFLSASACGMDDFEPANQVQGVRVLAVKKSSAYAKPGEKVTLEILYWDGKSKPEEQRPLEVTWFGGCTNPAGDLYYGCYPQLAELFAGPPSSDQMKLVGTGGTFELTIPADIVSSRPAPADGSPPYGLSYVFFTACSGRLGPPPAGEDMSGLPLGCYDKDDKPLGPDEFVPGYTSIYAYDELRNENPVIDGLLFDGHGDGELRVPRCSGKGCTKYTLKPLIDPRSAELDPIAETAPDGSPIKEQLWVNFYATGGKFDHPVRLVNDAIKGWNDRNETSWEPPKEPGTVVLWAVVRDNRGGVDWRERRVVVE